MKIMRVISLLVILSLPAAACGDDSSTDSGVEVADNDTPANDGSADIPDDDSAEDDTPADDDTANDSTGPPEPATPVVFEFPDRANPESADPALAAEAITAVGIDLHTALDAATAPGENLIASPASIAIALAMLEPGTAGEARTQLRELLRLDDPEAYHQSMNALEQSLEGRVPGDSGNGDPGEVEVGIANAAYLQQGYPFESAYLDTIGTHYGPVLRPVDFEPDPDAIAHDINDFVAETTNDRIPELIPDGTLDADTVLALVNALYLQASWLSPFAESETVDAPFTLLDGTEVEVAMMHGRSDTSAQDDGWVGATKALSGDLAVQFVLPDVGRFDEVEARIGDVFDEYDANRTAGASLAGPRFETRFSVELDAAFRDLGLTAVYQQGSLLGIANDPLLVLDKALHETFVAMDEEGIEAAAATVLIAIPVSGSATPPVPVVLDRPFLFRIVDRQTGVTLFLGRIMDPT